MACNFTVPFTKSATEILDKAKETIESQNGTFSGDENTGCFDVSVFGNTVKGNYKVDGQNLEIEITEKPFLVPCSMIESFLVSKLN